ncbi:secreted protein [Streptomyces zinciresistens K42]|uniref:Secreted protein n=1 Tax=Streptomyces zinciresistens K42 TaxID=700597 RepID=G2G6G5_9ACTN|nr:hypothetical protein [Streptomyces zinciresistens]EGX60856.1 secreted protein [Streptomyces zinciresistens K42]
MPRTPARTVLVPALCAVALLSAAACSAAGPGGTAGAARPPAARAPQTPAAAPTLTEAQARAALIGESDLGEAWAPTGGFATWRDSMLKAGTGSGACRRLLDALYTEDFFGPDATTRASVGLDDAVDGAQLRFQVVAHRPAAVDRTLAWLGGLPGSCGQFTATARGGPMAVRVEAAQLPEAGDARQGLRIVLSAVSEYQDAPVLTLDVAAVRVGDDAITVTNGSLGAVPSDATWTAVETGARRLEEIRKRGRAAV